jgi:iron-sulfur cluster assembly protein
MIIITEKAQKEVLRLMENEERSCFLRLSVQGSGCSGLSYKLEFDSTEREGDKTFVMPDFFLVVDGKSYLFVDGTTIDFSDGLDGKGFIYNNPKAARTCGCGTSFNIAEGKE